jgi:adenine-specific DNA-methyltransferase
MFHAALSEPQKQAVALPEQDWFEPIAKSLGTPLYSGLGIAMYHGDCLELMRHIPDNAFHLTITSPPYNIGKEYETVRSVDRYLDWCEEWIKEVYRVTRPDGAFWLNLGYLSFPDKANAIPIPYLLWQRIPFFLIQEVVWNYGAGVACRKMFSPRNEKFLWYVKNPNEYKFSLDSVRDCNVKYPNQKKNGKLKCNPLGKNPTDVWQFPKVTSGKNRSSKERTAHPAQFPLAVIERIIKACSNPEDIVFDPFAGSGTVAEAAHRTGRNTVGFEIEEKYVGLTQKRLSHYLTIRAMYGSQQTFF